MKIALITIILLLVWIRLSPVIPWTIEANEMIEYYHEREWIEEGRTCHIVYDWSWWSLRFTSVYPLCE